MFLAFGSVVLPVKAVVVNVLSVGAAFGVLVWGFQYGHLSGILHFTSTSYLEPTTLVLILALLFALATDYEVFLLSRVREEWARRGDNTAAVAAGLQRTGGLITAAALLLGVVTAGFASGQLVIAKLIGVGMVTGLALDAILVRTILVPSTMKLLGRLNWWLPAPLAAVYRHFGLQETAPPAGTRRGSVPVGGVAALDDDLVGDVLRVVPDAPDEARPAPRQPGQAEEVDAGLARHAALVPRPAARRRRRRPSATRSRWRSRSPR